MKLVIIGIASLYLSYFMVVFNAFGIYAASIPFAVGVACLVLALVKGSDKKYIDLIKDALIFILILFMVLSPLIYAIVTP